jgi:hypothetical protein
MEKSSKRGKIPQTDWPLIMARYEAGETLASIARTYDCSPPAISYIVSRTREKPGYETPPTVAVEPQLIKSTNGAAVLDAPPALAPVAMSAMGDLRSEPQRELAVEPPIAVRSQPERARAGVLHRPGALPQPGPPPAARPAAAANGEARPKLHLGFGNGHGNGNGNGVLPQASPDGEHRAQPSYPQPGQRAIPQRDGGERAGQQPFQTPPRGAGMLENGHNGRDRLTMSESRPPAQMPRDGAAGGRKDNSTYLDQDLRTRVDGDIAAFLTAFDAVLVADTQESRFGLREATDRLLRAGARTRIELERLEARVPLTPRESGGHSEPAAWRYR